MRKSKRSTIFVLAMALALTFGGCSQPGQNSSQTSSSQRESSSLAPSDSQEESSSSSQTEPESSSNPDLAQDSGALSSAVEPWEEVPQGEASSSQPEQPEAGQHQSALVYNDGAVFGSSQPEVLGTQTELDVWTSAMDSRDKVAYLWVSTFGEERALSPEEVTTILDTLAGLTPQVLQDVGNPPTGGSTNIIAYGADGSPLWKATVNESWLIVRAGGDATPRIFGIEGQQVQAIGNIAG